MSNACRLPLITLVCLLLAGCEKPEKMAHHSATLYRCSYPDSWKLTIDAENQPYESIELDLGSGRLIFLTLFHPDNPTTLEKYCEIVTTGFPENHHEAHADHTVTTKFSGESDAIGTHKGLSTRFSIKTPDQTTDCLYKFFRIANDNYLIFVEVFVEGDLESVPENQVAAFLSSIHPNRIAKQAKQSSTDQTATDLEPKSQGYEKIKSESKVLSR